LFIVFLYSRFYSSLGERLALAGRRSRLFGRGGTATAAPPGCGPCRNLSRADDRSWVSLREPWFFSAYFRGFTAKYRFAILFVDL